jgi:hypothetical protein
MSKELKVIRDCYDLAKYLSEQVRKFPRSYRYTLGADIERRVQGLLAGLLRVKYTAGAEVKTRLLSEINIELEVLRFQLRLAADLRAQALVNQGHAWRLVEGVGVQVGGWLRALPGRANEAGAG